MGKACWHGDDIDSIHQDCPVRKLIWMKAKAGPNRRSEHYGHLSWVPRIWQEVDDQAAHPWRQVEDEIEGEQLVPFVLTKTKRYRTRLKHERNKRDETGGIDSIVLSK